MERREIVLIGPIRAGKSTVGSLLARELGVPQVSMDRLSSDLYAEAGYDGNYARELSRRDPQMGYEYGKPFEAYAVEQLLSEYADCVFDLGAGHSVHEDPVLFGRVRRALELFQHVVLLLPSPDLRESARIVGARLGVEEGHWLYRLNEHFVRHRSNHMLARSVVYTGRQTPAQTCATILEQTRGAPCRPRASSTRG